MRKISKSRQGFTLIEMTVVLFIISLLVLIIIPNISNARQRAQAVHSNAMVSVVQSQVDAYLDDHSDNGNSQVTFDELDGKDDDSKEKYLTDDQVKKAENEKISINKDNKAVKAASAS